MVDDYKELASFKEEVIEASGYSYRYGFDDCNAKVKELFPNLHLNNIFLLEEEEKIIEEGEIQEEAAKEVPIEEVVPLVVTEAL